MIYFKYVGSSVYFYKDPSGESGYFGRVIGVDYDAVRGSHIFYDKQGKHIAMFWDCEPIVEICPTCKRPIKED